jgi:hypothetical protein
MSGGPGPVDGTVLDTNYQESSGNYVVFNKLFLLLSAAAAENSGHWVDFFPLKGGTVEVTVVGTEPTFSIQLYGSNATSPPADSYAGSALGSAIAAAGMTVLDYAPRYIKANLASISGDGAAVTVTLNAFAP